MLTFKEFVLKKEVSYNPFQNLGTGGAGDIAKYFGHVPGGVAASPVAAVQGLAKTPQAYRSMRHGNPYVSDNLENTKRLADTAFAQSTNWLLKYVTNEKMPNAKNGLKHFLQEKLQEVENYFNTQQPAQVAGVTMGQQPTVMGGIFALPISIITGITNAAKNIIDTLNPVYQSQSNEWAENVKKMILALEALNTWEKNTNSNAQLVNARINAFLHNLAGS